MKPAPPVHYPSPVCCAIFPLSAFTVDLRVVSANPPSLIAAEGPVVTQTTALKKHEARLEPSNSNVIQISCQDKPVGMRNSYLN